MLFVPVQILFAKIFRLSCLLKPDFRFESDTVLHQCTVKPVVEKNQHIVNVCITPSPTKLLLWLKIEIITVSEVTKPERALLVSC